MNREKLDNFIGEAVKWCVCAVIFAAPFSKSISEIAITLAIILWIYGKVVKGDLSLEKTPLNIALVLFVLCVIPSFINSVNIALSFKALFSKVLKYALFYFAIVDRIDTKDKLSIILRTALLSMFVIALDGLWQYYVTGIDLLHNYPAFKIRSYDGVVEFRGFPTASFPYPNDLAAWILLTLIPLVCVTIFGIKKNSERVITGLVSLTLFYLFFLAKTRGAWLALGISTIYIAISKRKIWLILFLVLLVAVPYIFKMEMASYIFSFSSASDRGGMWTTSWEIFKNHPVIGNGLNTFFINYMNHRKDQDRGKKGSYAHNCYLQMAADTGILGLASFLSVIYLYFLSIVKSLKVMKDHFYSSLLWGMSIGVFAFLVHSFFDTNLYSLNLVTLFWCAVGISQSIVKISGKEAYG